MQRGNDHGRGDHNAQHVPTISEPRYDCRVRVVFALCVLIGVGCATGGSKQQPVDAADPDAPPDANNCVTQPCDILTQCGCPGKACDIGEGLMGTGCRAIDTPGRETSTCAMSTECDVGFVCLFSQGASVGNCKRYCDADVDCGTPRGQCLITIQNGQGQPIPNIPKACTSNCDPTNTAAGGCPNGEKCTIFPGAGAIPAAVDCTTAGGGGQGASCQMGAGNGNDALCAPDNLCTTLDNNSFNCRRVCKFNGATGVGCVGAQQCLHFGTPLIVGGVEYGVCN